MTSLRPATILLLLAAALLAGCSHAEKHFDLPPLELARLPSPSELDAIPTGETQAQSRARFGTPYRISEHHGQRFEAYRLETRASDFGDRAGMTVHLDYTRDSAGIWRTTALHWWQNGSTARPMGGLAESIAD